mgnify:CR=1 FL=1
MTNIKSNCVFVMPLHFKAISHSPYRLDILWMRRVIFDFLPNLLNTVSYTHLTLPTNSRV